MKKQKEEKADLKIEFNETFNPEFAKEIKSILKQEQDKGNLTFEVKRRRKCDFCDKTLNEGDEFITLDCNLDKCEECQKKQTKSEQYNRDFCGDGK